jgi:Phytanoyl-CoA dioxygenase (PhyH)
MPVTTLDGNRSCFSPSDIGSEALKQRYVSEGWCVIRGMYDENDLAPVHSYINHLIDLKLSDLGLSPSDRRTTIRTEDYLRVCAADRAKGGEIYRACRNLLPLHRMAVGSKTEALASFLMGTNFINSNPLTAIRIDQKQEQKYLFDWHQDYPYSQGSVDGIVIWGGLFDTTEGYGGIKLLPRSHIDGIVPVEVVDPDNKQKNGAHSIRIPSADRFDELDAVRIDTRAGDIIAFSAVLLHKSIPMTKGDVRWTYQIRHANFSNADSIKRGWPGGSALGEPFDMAHPEFVVR